MKILFITILIFIGVCIIIPLLTFIVLQLSPNERSLKRERKEEHIRWMTKDYVIAFGGTIEDAEWIIRHAKSKKK